MAASPRGVYTLGRVYTVRDLFYVWERDPNVCAYARTNVKPRFHLTYVRIRGSEDVGEGDGNFFYFETIGNDLLEREVDLDIPE